jgi:hypothetical protein
MGEWALGPNGELALGCPDEYTFDVLRPGEPVLRISRRWIPLEVTEAEAKAISQLVVLMPGAL